MCCLRLDLYFNKDNKDINSAVQSDAAPRSENYKVDNKVENKVEPSISPLAHPFSRSCGGRERHLYFFIKIQIKIEEKGLKPCFYIQSSYP